MDRFIECTRNGDFDNACRLLENIKSECPYKISEYNEFCNVSDQYDVNGHHKCIKLIAEFPYLRKSYYVIENCIENDHVDCLKIVLGNKEILKQFKDSEWAFVYTSIQKAATKCLKMMFLEGYADPNKVSTLQGDTYLHHDFLYAKKNKENLDLLLTLNENVNSSDLEGYTPLFRAVIMNSHHGVTSLLQHGADKYHTMFFPFTRKMVTAEQLARDRGCNDIADIIRDF